MRDFPVKLAKVTATGAGFVVDGNFLQHPEPRKRDAPTVGICRQGRAKQEQLVIREAVGPVAAFTPWNFPVNRYAR
jgi:acyl-CoA reductase-like NAD-dependent aldehyde dehydrogenase